MRIDESRKGKVNFLLGDGKESIDNLETLSTNQSKKVHAQLPSNLSNKRLENIVAMEGKELELPLKAPCDIKKDVSFESLYDVLKELGRGSFGVVKECIDKTTGSHYAAKFIRKTTKTRIDAVREIETMNKLRHKKLVQIENAFETRREMIIVMEFIPGIELFEKIALEETPNLTEKQAIKYLKQILHGVNYMHNKSLVHLDLKPENILCLTTDMQADEEQIKLIDFGLAREVIKGSSVSVMCGTPEFVAPEVISFEPISTASDMWSLGVITYVLLSGVSPFLGDDDNETFQNVTLGEYDFEDEDDVFESVSENSKKFIEDLLHVKPKDRLTAEQCLKHEWLREGGNDKAIDKKYIRQFLAKRKWKKTITAIKAVGRFKQSSHSYLLRKTKSRLHNVNLDKPKSVFDVASMLKSNGNQAASNANQPAPNGNKTQKPKNVFDVCNLLKSKTCEEVNRQETEKPKSILQVCNLFRESDGGKSTPNTLINDKSNEVSEASRNGHVNKNDDIVNGHTKYSDGDCGKSDENKELEIQANQSKSKKIEKSNNLINGDLAPEKYSTGDVTDALEDDCVKINGHDQISTSDGHDDVIKPHPKSTKKVYDFDEMSKHLNKDLLQQNDIDLKERAMRRKMSRDRKKLGEESTSPGVDVIEEIHEEPLVNGGSKEKPLVNGENNESNAQISNDDKNNEIVNDNTKANKKILDAGNGFEKFVNGRINGLRKVNEDNKFALSNQKTKPENKKQNQKPETREAKGFTDANDIAKEENLENPHFTNGDVISEDKFSPNTDNSDIHNHVQKDKKPVRTESLEEEKSRNSPSPFKRSVPSNVSNRAAAFQKSNETEDIYNRKNRSHSVDIERLSLRKKNIRGVDGFINSSQPRRQSSAITGYNKDFKVNSKLNFQNKLAAFQNGCV